MNSANTNKKITIISFDHWNYDCHIVTALQKKNIDSFHIKIGNFKYKNKFERLKNSLSKIFLARNPKLKKRQDYIIKQLKKRGFQNQILVINPELIDLEYHHLIKNYTNKYIAYLYDSVSRCPVEHLLDGIFDEIYSFDKDDILKYGFIETTNYIYFLNSPQPTSIKRDYIYIGSIDNRIDYLQNLADSFEKENKTFIFYAIGKKAFINKIKQVFLGKYKNIIFKKNRFTQEETLKLYSQSNVIVDLVRDKQSGLSFRVFEAIGLQKNLLTNNRNITKYDFFEFNKISILNNSIRKDFSTNIYPEKIIEKYSISNWCNTVFKLN
jgi:hypothetical protein